MSVPWTKQRLAKYRRTMAAKKEKVIEPNFKVKYETVKFLNEGLHNDVNSLVKRIEELTKENLDLLQRPFPANLSGAAKAEYSPNTGRLDVGPPEQFGHYKDNPAGTNWVNHDYVPDPVNQPKHYKSHPSGIECIEVIRHMNHNKGAAMAYIWRAEEKGTEVQDLRKAIWYLNDEIKRIQKYGK